MPLPFAALERDVNAAILGSLTNAVAIVEGQRFSVIFEREYAEDFGAVDASTPFCTGAASALGALDRGASLLIERAGSTSLWQVLRGEPDRTNAGLVTLHLAPVEEPADGGANDYSPLQTAQEGGNVHA